MALSLSFKTFFTCVWFKGPVYNHSLFVVQSLSCVWLFATPWTVAGFSVLHHLPEFTQTHVHWVSDAIQPSHPLLPPSPLALNLPQHQGLFQWVSILHQVAKVLDLQLQHQSFHWVFRVDFLLDWLVWSPCCPRDWCPAPQFEGINSSVLSIFYCQLSYLYMTTGKTITLTIRTFVHKMMSLLFSTLSSFVIAILPRSKCLYILWLQSLSTLILEPKKKKSNAVCIFPPSIYYEVKGLDAMIFAF